MPIVLAATHHLAPLLKVARSSDVQRPVCGRLYRCRRLGEHSTLSTLAVRCAAERLHYPEG